MALNQVIKKCVVSILHVCVYLYFKKGEREGRGEGGKGEREGRGGGGKGRRREGERGREGEKEGREREGGKRRGREGEREEILGERLNNLIFIDC